MTISAVIRRYPFLWSLIGSAFLLPVDVRTVRAQQDISPNTHIERPMVIHVVSPLLCRNCLTSQARYLMSQGVEEQYLAAINVETKTAERFTLHNDSVIVSDIVTVRPVRKTSAIYASIEQFTKNIDRKQTLGILVLLTDGSGQFFEYTSSFGENGKIRPHAGSRLRDLLRRVSD